VPILFVGADIFYFLLFFSVFHPGKYSLLSKVGAIHSLNSGSQDKVVAAYGSASKSQIRNITAGLLVLRWK